MADATARRIGTLAELAAMPGMPSEPTLRKLIDSEADFPVISRGKNGVGYEIDLVAAAHWWKARTEAEQIAQRERADMVRQLGFEILGDDAVAPVETGLTATERRALIEEEFAATRLAMLRGDLVKRAEVEAGLGQFVALVAERSESLTQRLVRRVGAVPRETLAALEDILRADRAHVSDRMAEFVRHDANAAPADGNAPADSLL